MSEEPFSGEYFQHLLNSLTLNSRAIIVELTGIAERHTEHAGEIVQLIEERIVKILPKYKLYSFYLMDSIVKNIGNPYNLLFASNLHKIFTETYLVVTDTITRQNLINLFKTWISGQTTTGLEIFPQDVLAKIEQFIIKATTLNNNQDEGTTLTRDTLLREGNYLLQYVIAMDEDLEKFVQLNDIGNEHKEQIGLFHKIRNNLIYGINTISEAAMTTPKPEFEKNKDSLASELQQIRRSLDDQGFQQQALIRGFIKAHEAEMTAELEQKRADLLITVELQPKKFTGESFFEDLGFEAYVQGWGMPVTEQVKTPEHTAEQKEEEPEKKNEESLAASFGLNITSFNFQDSFLGSPKNELTSVASVTSGDESDDDGYDPGENISEQEHEHITNGSPTAAFSGKSSMKRAHADGEARVVKKVRFDV